MAKKIAQLRRLAHSNQSGLCYYCKYPIWDSDCESFARAYNITIAQAAKLQCTAEHLKARMDGGADVRGNIVAACIVCNRTRHRMNPPLPPDNYQKCVQWQVAQGVWHRKSIRKLRQHQSLS